MEKVYRKIKREGGNRVRQRKTKQREKMIKIRFWEHKSFLLSTIFAQFLFFSPRALGSEKECERKKERKEIKKDRAGCFNLF